MSNTSYYRSPFGDTTHTKVFVGGLAWETPTDEMRRYFDQFGEILEAVIITDKNTGKSKGYGFVSYIFLIHTMFLSLLVCLRVTPIVNLGDVSGVGLSHESRR